MKRRNTGAIIAVILTLVGLSAVVLAFMNNSSPYVTVAEAIARPSDNQHLSGDIVPGSVQIDYRNAQVEFQLKDQEGKMIQVHYRGSVPPTMSTATKVVAVGGVKNAKFESSKLMLKCPSKYESEGKKL